MRWLHYLCFGLLLVSHQLYAWSDHANLAWPLLSADDALQEKTLAPEPLADFVNGQFHAITQALAEHERWSEEHGHSHALTPASLTFTGDKPDLTEAFVRAIRINPTLSYEPYRQILLAERPSPDHPDSVGWAELSFLDPGESHAHTRYLLLQDTDRVSPAQVLATASDEPDMGMDVGLFANNGTVFGAEYGFGDQSFGNPNLSYGSQAPFHMGFYHLDWLTRTAQPGLLRTYPVWRIALYDRLAQVAFKTGHDYWGWRFMGWALHYIGDLTQPYHAIPLPGISTVAALWMVVNGETDAAIQRVSNRHGVLESYQYQRLAAIQRGDMSSAPWAAWIEEAALSPRQVRPLPPAAIERQLTWESVEAAGHLDHALATYVPYRYVSDAAFEWVGSGYEAEIVELVRKAGGDASVEQLDRAILMQLQRFVGVARGWLSRAQAHSMKSQPIVNSHDVED